ncbi:MAG: hypothetical protein WD275_09040 [Rhodothermales bacterium]
MKRLIPILLMTCILGCEADTAEVPREGAAGDTTGTPGTTDVRSAAGGTSSSVVEALQGAWRAQDDPAVVIRVQGNRITEYYDGELMADETVRAVRSCDEMGEDASSEYFIRASAADTLCYRLMHADDSTLAYTYAARGNTLAFDRIADSQ